MGCLQIGYLGLGSFAVVGLGLAIFSRQLDLRDTSISPDGKYVVSVLASPMLFAMPGGGSDASGEMKLIDAAGQELNHKSIDMVQHATIKWSKNLVLVGAIPDTWTLPPIENINILLFSAAYTGDEPEFNRLLAQGANVQFITTFGQTLLHAAVVGNNDGIVQEVLQKNVAINAIDHDGQTALHLGVGKNNLVVKYLLDKGVAVNILDRRGRTALTIAAAHGHRSNMQNLIDRGADINLTNSYDSPLWSAISSGKSSLAKLALVQLLLDNGAKTTPGLLHNALTHREPKIIELLKRYGARS